MSNLADVRALETAADHEEALARYRELRQAGPAEDRSQLRALALLIEDYEQHLQAHEPQLFAELALGRLEDLHLSEVDLAHRIGSDEQEVVRCLKGDDTVSLRAARLIAHELGLPGDVLLGEPHPHEDRWSSFASV